MTPLAHRIVKELTMPLKRRTFSDQASLHTHFRQEFHTFEVTQVRSLAFNLSAAMVNGALPSIEWSFLPAERTWIEWKGPTGRIGFLLIRRGDFAEVVTADNAAFASLPVGAMALHGQLLKVAANNDEVFFRWDDRCLSQPLAFGLMWQLYGFLLIINSPRVVGRTLHNPNRGLARKLSGRCGLQGVFPLQAWTEIVLRPETIDETNAPDVVTGLTGQVCQHWVRAHKQRYQGIWTLVGDYWRGDGSLGIKQSRYRLAEARQ
ncbi:hypothetical protein [Mesorhizobium sp. M0203]|uniref:hypothetical protein n=1 Tax=Mesorhizobium sp. M0203 TaxID=2956912 RepID=UPI0033375BB9